MVWLRTWDGRELVVALPVGSLVYLHGRGITEEGVSPDRVARVLVDYGHSVMVQPLDAVAFLRDERIDEGKPEIVHRSIAQPIVEDV